MRRRRRVLQVSTFPFLAVLLCAMGSLILLLLVIDRRAKAVARAKVEQVAARAVSEEAKQAAAQQAARQAEWEQRRRQLHELLAREEKKIVGNIQTVTSQAAAASQLIQAEEARFRELRSKLEAEAGNLLRTQGDLASRRASITRAGEKVETSKQELARLAGELEHLEQTLLELRALREREKQTYSLVPYKGRHGDSRRPIYVECTAVGLVFHPDRLVLEGPSLLPMRIREEVEHRIASQGTVMPVAADPAAQARSPYLLMLVRPDGIGSYYRTQAALVGLKIDFGYEFVDADWILDFSADDNSTPQQPWMSARDKGAMPADAGPRGAAPPRKAPAGIGHREGSGEPANPIVASRSPGTGEPLMSQGSVQSGPLLLQPRAHQGSTMSGGQGTGGALAGNPAGSGTGLFAGAPDSGHNGVPGVEAKGQGMIPGRGDAQSPGAVSGGQGTGGAVAGNSGEPGASLFAAAPGITPNGMPGPPARAPGLTPRRETAQSPDSVSLRSGGGGDSPGIPHPGDSTVVGSPSAAGGGNMAEESSGSLGVPKPAAGAGLPSGRPDDQAEEPGLPAGPRLVGDSQPRGPRRPPPLPLSRLLGNRDWLIQVECQADGLLVRALGLRIPAAYLESTEQANSILTQAVQKLIANRQATLRPGEPPYRPIIRFQVHPDGLRSYYLAYSRLEALGLPMTRENIEPPPRTPRTIER